MKRWQTVVDAEVLRHATDETVSAVKLPASLELMLLLCQHSQGEMCVSELEEQLNIRQPMLSQQLGVLRTNGVVSKRRQGKNIFYSVADPSVLETLAVLHCIYCLKET